MEDQQQTPRNGHLFPPGVPPDVQQRLRSVAEAFAGTAGLSMPKASNRWKDAKLIQKKASDLLKLVRQWHAEFASEAIPESARLKAEEDLLASGLNADELAIARAGLSPADLQFALIGLQVHMRAIQELHSASGGRPKAWRARRLVEIAVDEFRRVGLPVKRDGRYETLFVATCTTMFAVAGVEESVDHAVRKVLDALG